MMREVKHASLHGKGRPSHLGLYLKILTPKQMLQRLPIALAQKKLIKKYKTI